MRTRRIVLSWLTAGLALSACDGSGGLQRPGQGWSAEVDAAPPLEADVVADSGAIDKANEPHDAAVEAEPCREVQAQRGPARAAIMQAGAGSGSDMAPTITSEELYGGFQKLCAQCHGPTGSGDSPAAKAIPNPPYDLTGALHRPRALDTPAARREAAGSELALFVIFAVVWQKRFWHQAEDRAPVDRDCAIEQLPVEPQRRANQKNTKKVLAAPRQMRDSLHASFQQGILVE